MKKRGWRSEWKEKVFGKLDKEKCRPLFPTEVQSQQRRTFNLLDVFQVVSFDRKNVGKDSKERRRIHRDVGEGRDQDERRRKKESFFFMLKECSLVLLDVFFLVSSYLKMKHPIKELI